MKGFTLIEMMIVVALIAILASIAMPAYNGYINRGKIKTVQADLVALSLNLENAYRKRLSYPTHSGINEAAIKTAYTGWAPASSSFDFTATSSATTYSLQAAGKSGTGVNGCTISINNTGTRSINNTCPYATNGAWL